MISRRHNHLATSGLGADTRGVLYGDLRLDLLQCYFLTGIMSNYTYAGLWQINNGILAAFVLLTLLFANRKTLTLSPLLWLYGLLTLLSLFNHLLLWEKTGGVPAGARTMPVVFLAMLACRARTRPGLFKRAVVLNTLPLALLLPLGGIHISWGRLSTEYLNEYMHGFVPAFAFAVGVCALLDRRFRLLTMASFFASIAFIVFGASRKYFIYISLATFVLVVSGKVLSVKRIVIGGCVLGLIIGIVLPKMTLAQKRRFGENFSWTQHLRELVSREAEDYSTQQRRAFLEISIRATRGRWLGFGHANFPYVCDLYNDGRIDGTPGHSHAALAEALIIGGYPGLAIYIIMLLYLLRIGRKDPVMLMCLVWMFLQVFVQGTFVDKIIWPLMAIAERELQISNMGLPGQRKKLKTDPDSSDSDIMKRPEKD